MSEYAKNIWCWYLERSPWIKWALFIFVVIAILLIRFSSFFSAGKGIPRLDDSAEILNNKLEEIHEEDLKETKKMDNEFAKRILKEEEKRGEIEKERKRLLEEAKRVHKEIDSLADFDSIDRTINEHIERAIERRKRRLGARDSEDV